MYPTIVKVRSSNGTVNEYVRVVEAYRESGKVKQRVVADLGRKDVLLAVLPKLQRLLRGNIEPDESTSAELKVIDASTWGPVLAIRALFEQLGLWDILDRCLGRAKGVPFTDRAFVLVANRLIHPTSEHRLAGWLETDFLCDRMGRRLDEAASPRDGGIGLGGLSVLREGPSSEGSGLIPLDYQPLWLEFLGSHA
jgi:hypothetical protein